MIDPASSLVSFAQNAEDVVLSRLFREARGTYVDVGAADPDIHTVTRHFYERGWNGINLEPSATFHQLLVARRPRDVNLRVAVAAESGTRTFYESPGERGSSTLHPAHLLARNVALVESETRVMMLAEICEEHDVEQIDFLKIDCEGAEREVIEGHDWERWPPRVVVVEANEPEAWLQLLEAAGYVPALFDGINFFLARSDDDEARTVLRAPACVLDNFTTAEVAREVAEARAAALVAAPGARAPSSLASVCSEERLHGLLVLSSTSQIYSGIGRALFGLAERMRDRIHLTVAIDDGIGRNVSLVQNICNELGFGLEVGPAVRDRNAVDLGNADLPTLLARGGWDFVETSSWACAATHGALLAALGELPLVYTPFSQPVETVPMPPPAAVQTIDVHERMLRAARLTLAASPLEELELSRTRGARVAFLPPGCDFERFAPGAPVRPLELLFVGDLAEPRKRIDRVFALLRAVRERRPDARLVVLGNSSDSAAIVPEDLRTSCELRGYVSEEELLAAYGRALCLTLLSDYEAFGMPIVEAIACGCAVLASDLPVARSLFATTAGIHLVDPDDPDAMAEQLIALEALQPTIGAEIRAGRAELRRRFDLALLAERKAELVLGQVALHRGAGRP